MCGVIGLSATHPVAAELLDGLIHLQHRGQDAAGIVTSDQKFHFKKGKGLVREIFSPADLALLPGQQGIGHTRYPTSGQAVEKEIQPFWLASPFGIALAHNGNLTNPEDLAHELQEQYHCLFNTDSDSEILLHLLASQLRQALQQQHSDFFETLCQAVQGMFAKAQGAYSVVALIAGKGLIAFRDPHGLRPLVTGKRTHANGVQDVIIASENTMFHQLGFQQLENIQPGELLYVDLQGQTQKRRLIQQAFTPCIFEYVYFARPDATIDHIGVYRARLRLGKNLANHWQRHYPDQIPDVVIPAPFTSNTAALAFANALSIPYREGLYKNPFIGRTFIMANQNTRKRSVRYKLTPQESEIRGKAVLILDDSIVRGTTSKEIVSMVREYGPTKVYFATTCPPIKFPCFYGIDIPTRHELIAAQQSVEAIRDYLQVDELLYLDQPQLLDAVMGQSNHQLDHPCMACLDGCYVGQDSDEQLQQLESRRMAQRKESKQHDD